MRFCCTILLASAMACSNALAQAPAKRGAAPPRGATPPAKAPPAPARANGGDVWIGVSRWWANQREVVVSGVLKNGPAARAGLKTDDTILEIGGRPLRNLNDFHQALQALRPGAPVEWLIEREGERQKLSVTPEKLPADGGTGLLLAAAEAGETWAMVELGLRYGQFLGEFSVVERDDKQAATWLRKATQAGSTLAPLYLGLMYLDGAGVPVDELEAQNLFRKARLMEGEGVRKGVAAAASNQLAAMCLNGQGLPAPDEKLAFRFFRDAAMNGSLFAMHQVGSMYEQGQGTEVSLAEAARWYQSAAELGHAPSVKAFARLDARGVAPAQ